MRKEITNKAIKDLQLHDTIYCAINAADNLSVSLENELSLYDWIDCANQALFNDAIINSFRLKALSTFLREILEDMQFSGGEDKAILQKHWQGQIDDTEDCMSDIIKGISEFLTTLSTSESRVMASALNDLICAIFLNTSNKIG